MNEIRKLKRGLEDVSPLFRAAPPACVRIATALPSQEPEAWVVPDVILLLGEHGTLPLGFEMTQHVPFDETQSMLISLGDVQDGNSSKIQMQADLRGGAYCRTLSWDHFEGLFQTPLASCLAKFALPRALLLDIALMDCPDPAKVLGMADEAVFWVGSSFESLSHAYKTMKAASSLNPQLGCHMIYRGAAEDSRGVVIFE